MTPLERAALWVPLSVGGLVAAWVGAGLVLPQWQQWQQGQARLETLRASEAQVPLLRRQLAVQLEQQATAEHQQELLVRLIGGTGDLATVLAQVDRVAGLTGVQLDLYEPQEVAIETPAKAGAGAQAKPASPPPDPLAVEGLERQTVLLAAKGSFPQVLDFLRRMERLNLLVVQSDLQLALEDLNNGAPATPASATPTPSTPAPPGPQGPQPVQSKQPAFPNGPTKVVLKLNVSLYGRGLRPAAVSKRTLAAPG
jgi:type IV pilus assembly protein PilO